MNKKFTNKLETAKEVRITNYLCRCGHQPSYLGNGRAKYFSPLRTKERTPSFIVDVERNTFCDFGTGDHGDIIDLCRKMENKTFREAIESLSGNNEPLSPIHISSQPLRRTPQRKSAIKLLRSDDLQHRALINYLNERGISAEIAKSYLKEVYYQVNAKSFFALGLMNDKGGFASRNKYQKYNISPAYFSTIPKEGSNAMLLFEGFMDALSYLEYYSFKAFPDHAIILNSTVHAEKAVKQMGSYEYIDLFLDNDEAGEKAAKVFQNVFPHAVNRSKYLFPEHNDFNEFWMDVNKNN